MSKSFLTVVFGLFLFSCSQKEKIDLLVYNATIYTVDSSFSTAEAMAIQNGKIVATGKTAELEEKYEATERIDASGKFIYPGFIDAHAHFVGYGLSLQRVDLSGTQSWAENIERIKAFAAENLPTGQAGKEGWLQGRGWDQNDWSIKEFPTNSELNELF